jgi:hypothetical protein
MEKSSAAIINFVARPSSGRALQNQLKGIESLYDDALTDSGEMIGKVIGAAREAGVPPARIQKTLRLLSSSIAKALDARGDAHRCHQDCRNIMKTLNLPELGWGDVGPTPDWSIDDGANEDLPAARVPA